MNPALRGGVQNVGAGDAEPIRERRRRVVGGGESEGDRRVDAQVVEAGTHPRNSEVLDGPDGVDAAEEGPRARREVTGRVAGDEESDLGADANLASVGLAGLAEVVELWG